MNFAKMKMVLSRFNIAENIFRLSNHLNSQNDYRFRDNGKLLVEKSDGEVWNEVGHFDKGVGDIGKWEDLRFPASSINPPGLISDPDRSNEDGTYLFGAAGTEILMGVAQLPHSWKEGTELRPHIHWAPTTIDAGNIVWKFEYKLFGNGDTIPAEWGGSTITLATTEAIVQHIDGFDAVDASTEAISSMMLWRLSRLGAEATDTYPEDATLFEFDIHYLTDSFGSYLEFTK